MTYVKYCNQHSTLEKELFSTIMDNLSRNVDKNFTLKYDKYIADNLFKYYNEYARKARMFQRRDRNWDLNVQSHRLLGYLIKKYTQNEIYCMHS